MKELDYTIVGNVDQFWIFLANAVFAWPGPGFVTLPSFCMASGPPKLFCPSSRWCWILSRLDVSPHSQQKISWTSNLEVHIFEQVHSYKSGVWKELIETFSSWLLGSSHNGFRPVEEAPSDSNLETSGGLQGSDWLESITERKELEVYVCVFGFIGRSNVQVFAMWKVYTTMSSRISILEILERIEVLELIAVFLWRVCGAHWGWRLWKLYVFRNFRV